MKYEEFICGNWVAYEQKIDVRIEKRLALIVWNDEKDVYLHDFGQIKNWNDLIERYSKIVITKIVLHPDSNDLDAFSKMENPSFEILKKVQLAQDKEDCLKYGVSAFDRIDTIGVRMIASEQFHAALSMLKKLDCPMSVIISTVNSFYEKD